MFALGLQGSPRKKGNSDLLLAMFMDALAQRGAATQILDVAHMQIEPCKELTVCEKKGTCPIDDEMSRRVYGLLRKADLVVAASPVFFYNVSAQLKALIDRCQTLWARRYMLKLQDPGSKIRRGFLLGVGATKGKQLFDGMHLTAKYFFDGVSAAYAGSLTYRSIEKRGEIKTHPTVAGDVTRAAAELTDGLDARRRVLFVSEGNACRSQMAAAFTRLYAGDRFDAGSAGLQPAGRINRSMVDVMREKAVDMAFVAPQSFDEAVEEIRPDIIVTIGDDTRCPDVPGAQREAWSVPGPPELTEQSVRTLRDEIERHVRVFIS